MKYTSEINKLQDGKWILNMQKNKINFYIILLVLMAILSWSDVLRAETSADRSQKTKQRCPPQMVIVESKENKVRVCVDRYEYTRQKSTPRAQLKPVGYQSQLSCKRLCKSKGDRLLTDKEWKEACKGTNPERCNIYGTHPILKRVYSKKSWHYARINCKLRDNRWSKKCMNDPSLNNSPRGLSVNRAYPKCVSKYGIYNMVGNLGEWVSWTGRNSEGQRVGKFNGGLYPQIKSSCEYETKAHGPNYRDYSIGCRCGRKPNY